LKRTIQVLRHYGDRGKTEEVQRGFQVLDNSVISLILLGTTGLERGEQKRDSERGREALKGRKQAWGH
jgi:hypothetical protein